MKLIFGLFVITCFCAKINAQIITKATVISAPLYMTSTFRISCDLFDNSFQENKKQIEIKTIDFKTLQKLLSSQCIKTTISPDVRGKLVILFQNRKMTKICFSEFGDFFDGTKYFKNKALFQFLLKKKLIEN